MLDGSKYLKNDSSTIPFDVKLQALQGIANCTDIIENGIPIQNGIEALPLLPACSPSFSSIVDEVFEYDEDGPTAKQNQSVPPSGMAKRISAGSDGTPKKRSLSDFLESLPSLYGQESESNKRRKISESMQNPLHLQPYSSNLQSRTSLTCENVLMGRKNCVPATIYASVLLHVIRHCSLCIKHAQLTAQMDSLAIPYVEEVGLRTPSSNLWLRLPFAQDDSWKHICLRLGKAGSMSWEVRINDPHFRELWELNGGSTTTKWGVGIRIANTSEMDSHISFDADGVVLNYSTVEVDSVQRLVSDLRRLSSARSFAHGMRRLIGVKLDDKIEDNATSMEMKSQSVNKGNSDGTDKLSEQIRKTFRIEAVGLMSLWFSYGTMPMVHIVVEWETAKGGGAIRPARMPVTVSSGFNSMPKQSTIPMQASIANGSSSSNMHHVPAGPAPSIAPAAHLGSHNLHAAAMLSAAGRGGPGLVPSSLLPFDVSVVLRGPYWIRIIYRKKFSVDMRCFAGDQVWLQPATPPKGGPSVGGSLPCPQFRPFIMEHVAQGLNALEPNFMNAAQASAHLNINAGAPLPAPTANRLSTAPGVAMSRPTSGVANHVAASLSRAGNAMLATSALASGIGAPVRLTPGTGLPVHMKGELNTAFIGLGDDGGYGGGWVPLAALKKVLRGILKYLGVL
ncbi:hypothetical protein PR202_ga16852 [Eleusine coracana subsp. coracana]|uniref:Mediator of RNA polymerase II transcription subunit 14 n=1 Tax=Eleusine coracana subsp. coracana TaxID=191504 RepID=A0AAV5CNH5_ELECO|nr:hypothetical protein PR202_ga16852 [Eleusine coracana subsp. coracana]